MDPIDDALALGASPQRLVAEITNLFGMYRAEYADTTIARVFQEPIFWQSLTDRRPTFLVGGRGTGKTVALRMVAYDGQRALHGDSIDRWPVLGIYWRMSVLALSAFKGPRLDESEWTRLFSHWVNLQLVGRILRFVSWRKTEMGQETSVDGSAIRRTALSLGLVPTEDYAELSNRVEDHLAEFQALINNTSTTLPSITLSMLGAPLETVLQALSGDPIFSGRLLAICLDEFENLETYQQRVVNSLLKHVGDAPYTLKIGVKPTGIRDRHTLNAHESISAVADYALLEIVEHHKEQGFAAFAERVCTERLQLLSSAFEKTLPITALFEDLSDEEEAARLGVDARLLDLRSNLVDQGATAEDLREFDRMGRVSSFLIGYWARSTSVRELAVLREAVERPKAWANRVNNYGYAAMFTIRETTGPTVRKYFAGWSTMVLLADGNIRYLLDLVSTALTQHVQSGNDMTVPVDASVQTRAAANVGEKLAFDLEGQDDLGRQIMLLVLGLGRILGVMAREPWGHTPEVNQFRLDRDGEDEGFERLLNASIMHSGIVRFPGDKRAAASGETRAYDYQLHPIFAAYFEYSHRRKRRFLLSAATLTSLADASTAGRTIERILRSHKRSTLQYTPGQLFDWPGVG